MAVPKNENGSFAVVDMPHFMKSLLREFGGNDGLAKQFKNEFVVAKEGGMVRQKLIQEMLACMRQVSNDQKRKGVEDNTDEELSQEVDELKAKRDRGESGTAA